jgi:hypothetical protein
MGLFSIFSAHPSPLGWGDVADDRLPTLGDVDMLHRHLLLAAASVSLQCLDLRCERPGELVEGVLGAVLLYDKLDMRQASGERHRRVVDGGHLSTEHRLDQREGRAVDLAGAER